MQRVKSDLVIVQDKITDIDKQVAVQGYVQQMLYII